MSLRWPVSVWWRSRACLVILFVYSGLVAMLHICCFPCNTNGFASSVPYCCSTHSKCNFVAIENVKLEWFHYPHDDGWWILAVCLDTEPMLCAKDCVPQCKSPRSTTYRTVLCSSAYRPRQAHDTWFLSHCLHFQGFMKRFPFDEVNTMCCDEYKRSQPTLPNAFFGLKVEF